MKRFFTYCTALLLSAFFLLAGTGLNVVHYCCNTCREAGIAHVTEESCEVVHQEKAEHACAHHHHTQDCHHQNGCWFKHLTLTEGGISHSVTTPHAEQMPLLYGIMPAQIDDLIPLLFSQARIAERGSPHALQGQNIGRQMLSRGCKLSL